MQLKREEAPGPRPGRRLRPAQPSFHKLVINLTDRFTKHSEASWIGFDKINEPSKKDEV